MRDLDIRTLSFLAMVSGLLLAVGLHLVKRVMPEESSLRFWTHGANASAVAYVLLAMRGIAPDLLSIVVANTLLVVATVFWYLGNRQFRGFKAQFAWYWVLTAVLALLLWYFTYEAPNLAARLIVVSAALAAPLFASAMIFLRPGETRDKAVRAFVATAFALMSLLMAARATVTLFMTSPGQDFMTVVSPVHTFSLIFGVALNITLGIGLPLLLSGRVHSRLLESEDRYRTLYQKTPAILHSIDTHGRLVQVSDFWTGALGYTRDEVIGRKSSEFLTPESRRFAVEKVLPEFFQTGLSIDIAYQFVTKDGRTLDFELSALGEYILKPPQIASLKVKVEHALKFRG